MSSNLEFLEEFNQNTQNAKVAIEEAKDAFEQCLVEASGGASAIVKKWAKFIKNDEAQMEAAFEHAEENDLAEVYTAQIKNGKSHRLCYRTFFVNAYIYAQINADLEASESISRGIDDLFDELNGDA